MVTWSQYKKRENPFLPKGIDKETKKDFNVIKLEESLGLA